MRHTAISLPFSFITVSFISILPNCLLFSRSSISLTPPPPLQKGGRGAQELTMFLSFVSQYSCYIFATLSTGLHRAAPSICWYMKTKFWFCSRRRRTGGYITATSLSLRSQLSKCTTTRRRRPLHSTPLAADTVSAKSTTTRTRCVSVVNGGRVEEATTG